mmetsp:Transcript_1548/g.2981  ORF Transcript_1548/g.2981 Transcript_1548/m.2981 type:complete len:138 (-) Transcript_1548:45-458(-)
MYQSRWIRRKWPFFLRGEFSLANLLTQERSRFSLVNIALDGFCWRAHRAAPHRDYPSERFTEEGGLARGFDARGDAINLRPEAEWLEPNEGVHGKDYVGTPFLIRFPKLGRVEQALCSWLVENRSRFIRGPHPTSLP